MHVADHADGLLKVVEFGSLGRQYNLGGDSEISNLEIILLICKLLDEIAPLKDRSYSKQIKFVKDRPGHDKRYSMDISRATIELDWRPKISLSEGLRDTILWYLNNEEWWRPLLNNSGIAYRLGLKTEFKK